MRMDREQAADRLRDLATDSGKRSKSAQLRDVFREIEDAIEAGVSQVTILEELRAMGLDVNPNTFRSTLRRLRAGRAAPAGNLPLTLESRRAPFADTSGSSGPSTTARGALYDVEALSRLLLASSYSRPPSWRA